MSAGTAIIVGILLTGCGGDATAATSPSTPDAVESEAGDIDEVVDAAERAIEDVEDVEDAAAGAGESGSLTIDGESYNDYLAIQCSVIGINVLGLGPDAVPYLLALIPEGVTTEMLVLNAFGLDGDAGGAQLIHYPFQGTQEVVAVAETFTLNGGAPATLPEAGAEFEASGTLDGFGQFQLRGSC